MYWLTLLTVKNMFSRDIVRYRSLPINLLYGEASGSGSPSSVLNFRLESMGRVAGLLSIKPLSSSSGSVYFVWVREVPSVALVISKSKKYLTEPVFST